jgi:hypothetical protein
MYSVKTCLPLDFPMLEQTITRVRAAHFEPTLGTRQA